MKKTPLFYLPKKSRLNPSIFQKKKNKILLFTNAKKVWRYKTRGDYFVFDLKKKKLIKIGKNFPHPV